MIFVDTGGWKTAVTAKLMSEIITKLGCAYYAQYGSDPIIEPNPKEFVYMDWDLSNIVIFCNVILDPPFMKRNGNVYSTIAINNGIDQKYYHYVCLSPEDPIIFANRIKTMVTMKAFL